MSMNWNKECTLTANIYMAPSESWSIKWSTQHRSYPYLPTLDQIVAELCSLSLQGEGVPATIAKATNGNEHLCLYGSSYKIGLYRSPQGDGYILAYIDPLDLRTHEALADGVLMVKETHYFLLSRLAVIPEESTNHWDFLRQKWIELEQQKQQRRTHKVQSQQEVTLQHKSYLTMLEDLVKIKYELERDKYKLSAPIPYLRVESVGEQRNARQDSYAFYLVKPHHGLSEKFLLRIQGMRNLRGRIFSIEETKLTVKFDTLIDKEQIPRRGNLEITPNNTILEVQRRAIKILDEGEAKNPYLLRLLVDHCYQPHHPAQQLNHKLNTQQLAAFQHALTVPDMMLVLGPPGTGKTHTITEIARHHCQVNHKRVLVASGTHKAVDNVLKQLPEELEVVRVGFEDNVAENARHLHIDAKEKKMQATILQQTEARSRQLTNFIDYKSQILAWCNHMTQLIKQIGISERFLAKTVLEQQSILQKITASYSQNVTQQEEEIQFQQQQLTLHTEKLRRLQARWIAAEARKQTPLIGSFFVWLSHRYEENIYKEQALVDYAQCYLDDAVQTLTSIQDEILHMLRTDDAYQLADNTKKHSMQTLTQLKQNALKLMHTMVETTRGQLPTYTLPKFNELTTQKMHHFLQWYNMSYQLLERRALLLRDWRKVLEERTEQLWPEILQHADVIGATCIGIATVTGLENIDFDLAIIDEAGQICLPDLLVPLVRAKRAVLVGDHQQLPPFVDHEVQNWLKGYEQSDISTTIETNDVVDLLTRSTFELLFQDSDQHKRLVRLHQQFRMPKTIAEFVSRSFYNKQLQTAPTHKSLQAPHHDPLFRSALALIDTSTVAVTQREQQKLATDSWERTSRYNLLEAELVAHIAMYYERVGLEWVVIVPYKAQAQYVIEALQKQGRMHGIALEERVDTVDSFQGRERDKVIYSFTRSNTYGGIGFLKELRRLNVAMTRCREQLVMVGDFATLRHAKDIPFRDLVRSLYDYSQQYGEIITYEQCQLRLTVGSTVG